MRTSKRTRVLSMLLVVIMVATLLPTAAFAAGTSPVNATLVTDAAELAIGDQVIIASKDANYALGTNQKSNNREAVAVQKSGNELTAGSAVQILTLEAGTVEDTFAFSTGSGYLYAASSSSNYLRTEGTKSANSSWAISIAADGKATVIAKGENTRNVMRYNAGNSNSSPLFSAYKGETSCNDMCIYKVAVDPYADIDKSLSVYEKVAQPQAGDKVIIYNAKSNYAVSSTALQTYYLTPVSITPVAELGVLAIEDATVEWTVSVDENGLYSFTQGETALTVGVNVASDGKTKTNLNGEGTAATKWHLDTCNSDNSSYYMYGDGIEGSYGSVYLEYYLHRNKTTGVETPEFTAYSTGASKLNEDNFGMTFYKLVRDGVDEDKPVESELPKAGDEVVIYNQNSKGVLAAEGDNSVICNALATVSEDGKATPANGGAVFKVEENGTYLRFYNETYGYLCSNGTGNNAFYSKDFSEEGVTTEDADWTVRTCSGGVGGFEMESRTAKFNGRYSQWLEYYNDSFKSYSMYNVTDYTIYSFFFYPVAEGVNVDGGLVIKPTITFAEAPLPAYVGVDYYEIDVTVDTIFEIDNPWTEYSLKDANGNYLTEKTSGEVDVEFPSNAEFPCTVTFPVTVYNEGVVKAAAVGDSMTICLSFKDVKGNVAYAEKTVQIKDEPVIDKLTPAQGAETGNDKQPVISASVINAATAADSYADPTVTMTVNGTEVSAVYTANADVPGAGTISYTPAEALADGKVNVSLTVTRADGVSSTKSWSFTVGETKFELYFGQLHSHTGEYSDGSGKLSDALSYVKNLPESANVDFVAFTDHSNYFDGSKAGGTANPEQALYDMSLANGESQALWNKYKSTVAEFNKENAGELVAVAGFEMTWSGGPGHINTFNTPGIVSRNNTTLNNKTSDAGMKAYYALLSQSEGAGSVSQFNHPGTTFGNFTDFSYWDAVVDSRIFLVEVGNGEGQIGAGGYYPSYEQYIMALDKGWHVAPTNNQDNHKGKWGNANDARDVILTDNFTEEGLYEALRAMRVYSTEDKNLEIGYTINDMQLGSSITEVPEKLNINVSVYDPDKSDSTSKVEVVVNSGKVAYTWDDPAVLATGELSVELAPEYSYYFIRVTQADGNLAVTAPIWVGENLKLGISSVECGTSTPVTGEELELTTTVFNSEASEAEVTSVVYSVGSQVIGTDTESKTIGASETKTISFKYTPDTAKATTITVTVNIKQDGKDYTFYKDIELDILDSSKLVYIGIDAAHYNEYVAGNYSDSMGNFSNLAAGQGVRTVELKTSEDLIAACANDKYKALILTAPSRRLAAAQAELRCYTEAELSAIKSFNANGGTVIVAGWSDHYEYYPETESIANMTADQHMAAQQNALLAALGSSLRIGDDATYDDVYSKIDGCDPYRLYFNTYNFNNFLTEGVEVGEGDNAYNNLYTEKFSHYGGASIYAVDASGNATSTLPSTVSPVVYGHSSTYSKDTDNDGLGGSSTPKYAYAQGDDRLMIMASEQIGDNGLIIVSGAAFMSNFEVQATISDNGSEKNYSNYRICENLVSYINPIQITNIADVQAETEEGISYTVEGIVTSNASGYDADTAFFDCIYVQDGTAGINVFPVAGNYKIGDKVRITGTTSSYQGERQLAVKTVEKIGDGTAVAPKFITAQQLNDGSVLGTLSTVSGVVTRIEVENGLVQTIMVKDEAGNLARVFIDGYITKDKEIAGLEVGCYVKATGLASYDNSFALDGETVAPRLRVRDRADIVCSENASAEFVFTDVGVNQWFYEYVDFAFENKLMTGTTAATFEPDVNMTREMFATVIYRMAGSPSVEGMTAPFTDIRENYAHDAIIWAYNVGVVNGATATTFDPDAEISRAQVVTMLYRYAGTPAVSGSVSFTDAERIESVYSWAVDPIIWATQNGIVNGYPNGAFGPDDTATRAQVAKMLSVFSTLA